MKKLCAVIICLCAVSASAQNQPTVSYIQSLSAKSAASVGDAVSLFSLQYGGPAGFAPSCDFLIACGILPSGTYDEQRPLRRGLLAVMTARSLKLKDSLFYRIFGTGRYAYTACCAYGIMQPGGSEFDIVSGPELIEVTGKISDREAPDETQ